MNKFALLILPIAFLNCMSLKSKDENNISEDNLGDRTAHSFRETVISIPITENPKKYENLHFVVTAFINPKESVFGSSTYNAVDLVEKLESRTQSELLKALEFKEPIAWRDLYKLKPTILQTVKKVFDVQYAKWSLRDKYTVEFAITVFYVSNNIENRDFSPRDYYSK
ncbi:hypothetical protein [Turneriella parva]|uniref:Uncharacterized protein n=1 Tax=Turneriella parva (strain ATCC BAA-1111 / DSM 21527 / NCTC 11395 / H) TaxID=869212 RepID=I4B9S4_TURPD|nr:hypothetical protein [Turneriella parva]AFM14031.1 hypothetical protein Turpa_3393 [Turneriella parva DSM 21527]